ncbi:hypothetical protein P154DRAFT_23102 [Amniculicola lignicola CBS 123094]|uniref:Uncharacterized protein n=1 Tax=Amniculicola lignicola CBS 123094 TaxID=1392246 RepID=A0A6A5WT01_9PLEO|nr:hypothetical protein P154DRAFT_23102 [Amniculicola lignicola CBS 123094]
MFGYQFGVNQLVDDTIDFLFDFHIGKDKGPSMRYINRVLRYKFEEAKTKPANAEETYLFKFFTDLHIKFGPQDLELREWAISPDSSSDKILFRVPKNFTLEFYKRTYVANSREGATEPQPSNSSSKRPRVRDPSTTGPSNRQKPSGLGPSSSERKPWVIKLCDYHCHPKDGRKCPGLYKDKIYITE